MIRIHMYTGSWEQRVEDNARLREMGIEKAVVDM